MANPEHVALVMAGSAAQENFFRSHVQSDSVRSWPVLDLSGADLRGASMESAWLPRADLRAANLTGVRWPMANLLDADMRGVRANGIDLSHAALAGANLGYASVTDANLEGVSTGGWGGIWGMMCRGTKFDRSRFDAADLTDSDFRRASFRDADLARALFGDSIFGRTDFTGARGLATARHSGPSSLDFATAETSGDLPAEFLRGCGLTDRQIEYLPSLVTTPLQTRSCFISYSTKDDAFARKLHRDLQANGVRCWFAPDNLRIGDRTRNALDLAIQVHDRVLVVLSQSSISSQWVEQEVEAAIERERQEGRTVLFPVRIDDAVMTVDVGWAAFIRRTRNIGDFQHWRSRPRYDQMLKRLLSDLGPS